MGRTRLACDTAKLSAVGNWHAPGKVHESCTSVLVL